MLPHGDQGATRSLGMLSGLPPLPQSSGRPTAAQADATYSRDIQYQSYAKPTRRAYRVGLCTVVPGDYGSHYCTSHKDLPRTLTDSTLASPAAQEHAATRASCAARCAAIQAGPSTSKHQIPSASPRPRVRRSSWAAPLPTRARRRQLHCSASGAPISPRPTATRRRSPQTDALL